MLLNGLTCLADLDVRDSGSTGALLRQYYTANAAFLHDCSRSVLSTNFTDILATSGDVIEEIAVFNDVSVRCMCLMFYRYCKMCWAKRRYDSFPASSEADRRIGSEGNTRSCNGH